MNGAFLFPWRWKQERAVLFRYQAALPASVVTSFFEPVSRSTTICTGNIMSTWGMRVIIYSRNGVEYSMDKNQVFSPRLMPI